MAKAMTKAEMQERIEELNDRLNQSNEAYMELQRRYNALNEQKGDIVGFNALKEQYRQLEIRYNSAKNSLEFESKHREELREKYQIIYAENKKLKESISINNSDYVIYLAKDSVSMEDLTDIFKKIGIEVTDADENEHLRINFDTQEVKNKLKRNAGREKKQLESQISVAEVRERMQKGETGEQIAKEIGISRASLFRKLKDAEKNGQKYIK